MHQNISAIVKEQMDARMLHIVKPKKALKSYAFGNMQDHSPCDKNISLIVDNYE